MEKPNSGKEYARKFEKLLETYPRSDGAQWRGVDFHNATNGVISKGYITALKKGRMDNPGIPKLKQIAEVMGVPFRLWFEPVSNWEIVLEEEDSSLRSRQDNDFAFLLNRLLELRSNPQTGEPYTDSELSVETGEVLSEGQIGEMRVGQLENPTRKQLIALSGALGVDPAYWFRGSDDASVFDPETYEALKENKLMLKRSLSLSSGDKELILTLLDKLEKAEDRENY